MENPRALVHPETQHGVPLVTVKTMLLEQPPYECPSPLERQCDDQFTMCCVSVTYSYEGTAIIDPSKTEGGFPPTATEQGSPVVETEGQVSPTSP